MKPWLLTLLLLSVPGWRWLTHVRDHNAAQTLGRAAWQRGQAAEAAYYFGQAAALAGRGGPAPALLLSLGQAQLAAGQPLAARATLTRLLSPAVPAPVGSAARQQLAGLLARQGQPAQALGLLRQALRLDPANTAARYNYETLSQYLARNPADEPDATPPASGASPPPPGPNRQPNSGPGDEGQSPRPGSSGNQPKPEGTPNAPQPQPGGEGQAPTPSPSGQPDRQPPAPSSGSGAAGGPGLGTGPERPVPSGSAPGRQRGLGPAGEAGGGATGAAGRSGRPGTEAATDADQQLQTQRERLRAMNLSPAQARQLLEELRASEQQYLQQRPRARQGAPPAPGTPTW